MSKTIKNIKVGEEIWKWAKKIINYNRSITGKGTLDTLNFIKLINEDIKIKFASSRTKVFDWVIPDEWEVKEAYIEDTKKNKIINFKTNNLYVLNYSISVNKNLKLSELKKNIFTNPKVPKGIPYRTSYYNKKWGFCMEHSRFKKLKNEIYHVCIQSKFFKGKMYYGEFLKKGKSKKEILLSTYICHPSMANNETSGIVLLTALSRYIKSIKDSYYSYRIIFVPETIGSIYYIHKNLIKLKKNVVGGYVVSCVGDNKNYSYIETKYGDAISDKIAKFVFKENKIKFKLYSYLTRGADERQFGSPNINLPIGSILRTRHGRYKEYHTSLDNMQLVTKEGFETSFKLYQKVINVFESNRKYKLNVFCEPFFTKYSLTNHIGGDLIDELNLNISNFCAYCDGENDLIKLSEILNIKYETCVKIAEILYKNKIIRIIA